MTRQMLTAETFDEIVAQTVQLAHKAGATTVEMRYDPIDRVLGPGESVLPDEPIRWTIIVTAVGHLSSDQRVGSAVSARGEETNQRAIQYACIRVLELLGTNLVVVDPSDQDEPAW
jgi:hypothetical protein